MLDSMLEAWKETGFEDENENMKLIRNKFGIKICSEEEVLTVITTCSTNAFRSFLIIIKCFIFLNFNFLTSNLNSLINLTNNTYPIFPQIN